MRRALTLFAAITLASCGTPPEQNACANIVAVTNAGMRDASGRWVVGGLNGDRVRFAPFTTYRIPHGLGRVPTDVQCYLSFSVDGALAQQIGSACLLIPRCAGGAADGGDVVWTDSEVIVRNSGSQDFWARFIIQ